MIIADGSINDHINANFLWKVKRHGPQRTYTSFTGQVKWTFES